MLRHRSFGLTRYETDVAQRKTLTEQQVDLLRWISEGCPDEVMEDYFHRISAAALRRRGLVTTAGRGPTWSAKLTEAGREYLSKVESPDPPKPRQANVSVTQQLVDDILAAGGSVRVPRKRWGEADGVDYENRALMAERYGKVPDGMRLEVSVVDDELELRLVDVPGAISKVELVPIEVPQEVSRYHPVARRFRDLKEAHEISRAQLRRAVRIVHTVALESERRGWPVAAAGEVGDENDTRVTTDGRLRINAAGHRFWLRLHEQGVHARGSWEATVQHYRDLALRWGSYSRDVPSGPYDAEGTGELKLELEVKRDWIYRGRQSRWADRKSWSLEERLPHVFREIEARAAKADRVAEEERVAAEKAAEEARRAAEERERRWHLLMEQAKGRLVETQRANLLREQVNAWQEAERLRSYCDAMEAAYDEDPKTSEWIAWARQFASRIDPLREAPSTPEPPEETPEALQEHLPEGWSVHGPEHGQHRYGFARRWQA